MKRKIIIIISIIIVLLIGVVLILLFNNRGLKKDSVSSNVYYYNVKEYSDAAYINDYLYLLKESTVGKNTNIIIDKAKLDKEKLIIKNRAKIGKLKDFSDVAFVGSLIKISYKSNDQAKYYTLEGEETYFDSKNREMYYNGDNNDYNDYLKKLNKVIKKSTKTKVLIEKDGKCYIYLPNEKVLYVVKK